MKTVNAQPLSEEAYAPYGEVVAAGRQGAESRNANLGTATRYLHLARLENLRPNAELEVSVFQCDPRTLWPMEVTMLERHPSSSQLFIPMAAQRFVAVVALGKDAPDLSTLRAFVTDGRQGLSYRPGVWHHPMIALDVRCDFTSLVFEDGTSADCDERHYSLEERPWIVL